VLSLRNELADESGRNPFAVDAMLTHRDVILQVLFMHAAKRAQKVTQRSPTAFAGVGLDFFAAVAVIVTRPFVLAVTDGRVCARQVFVATPFVGVTGRAGLRRRPDVLLQSGFVRMRNDGPPYLPARTTKGTDDRRTVIFIGAVTFAFIRAPTWRIVGVEMRLAFFPPRSETSRRFQLRYPAAG
jgi:hypothetical protein